MTEQKKKQLDDTDLEWYGLTDEDIERIKNEKDEIGDVNSKELLLATEIAEMFYLRFWIDLNIDDIILLIRKTKLVKKSFNAMSYKDEKIYS